MEDKIEADTHKTLSIPSHFFLKCRIIGWQKTLGNIRCMCSQMMKVESKQFGGNLDCI